MPSTQRKSANHSRVSRGGRARANGSRSANAISLLKADHRQVEEWFDEYEKARSTDRKLKLAREICRALEVHTMLEEELFYPAFLQATGDTSVHHQAELEHANAKKVIAEIQQSSPDDEYYDSRVKVLSEMIKHHVREEEGRDGMFAGARDSDMDLMALGEEIKNRKEELMAQTKPS
jgi:hemerythrin superfamily protein